MLSVNPIINVNNTPNNNVSFGRGVQTNYGIKAASPKNNMVEGGLLTGFVGTVSPIQEQEELKPALTKQKLIISHNPEANNNT